MIKKANSGQSSTLAYSFTMEAKAPLDYVFNWCTDFREDDTRITGSDSHRVVLEKGWNHAIYVALNKTKSEHGNRGGRIYFVKMQPPNMWKLEAHGNGFDTTGKYHLSRISNGATRLQITFVHKYYDRDVMPLLSAKEIDSKRSWKKYVESLEKDFIDDQRKHQVTFPATVQQQLRGWPQ